MKIRLNEDAEIVKTVKEGLKARGGYTVSMAWKKGRITRCKLSGVRNGKVTLVYNGMKKTIKVKKDKNTIIE
mgnify:CR=1 FL=1